MAVAVPNLWPETLKPVTISPIAVLRTQAAHLKERTGGLLEAHVTTRTFQRWKDEENRPLIAEHEFSITAPRLGYRRGIFTVEHDYPGAYPAVLSSWFLKPVGHLKEPIDEEMPSEFCFSQSEFLAVVGKVLQSRHMSSLLESLIAQINDASDPDADG